MKIFVHDYPGHAFPTQLSRWLAEQGHNVLHCYSADIESPRGDLGMRPNDALCIEGINLGRKLAKYNIPRRLLQERRYVAKLVLRMRAFAPDIVISNAPPNVQRCLLNATSRAGGVFVYWLQDIYSAMVARLLRKRLGLLAGPAIALLEFYDFAVMRDSDAVVVISEDFVPYCRRHGVKAERLAVIRNWASLDEIVPMTRRNYWSARHGLDDKFVFLFSGTLGLKHNPVLLSSLAMTLRNRPDAVVAVVSQGAGRAWLEAEKERVGLSNLLLFDYQPYRELSGVLATADAVIAILEPFAGELSVPSKVLSYFCAGRPILAAMPLQNLAARSVVEAGAGTVVTPDDQEGFIMAALSLLDDAEKRGAARSAARAYATRNFKMNVIGARFLEIFSAACRAKD